MSTEVSPSTVPAAPPERLEYARGPGAARDYRWNWRLIGGGVLLLVLGWMSLLLVPGVSSVWGGTALVIVDAHILPLGAMLVIWGVVKSTPRRS